MMCALVYLHIQVSIKVVISRKKINPRGTPHIVRSAGYAERFKYRCICTRAQMHMFVECHIQPTEKRHLDTVS